MFRIVASRLSHWLLVAPLALAGCAHDGAWTASDPGRAPITAVRAQRRPMQGAASVPTGSAAVAESAAAAESARAAEPVDLATIAQLREEGFQRSQVMDILWHLTDVYGPRLTNSPQQRKAAEWASGQLAEWGLQQVAVEPWGEFGLGWSLQRCVVEMTEPSYMSLIAVPKAWTSGLAAPVEGAPLLVEASTAEELERYRGQLAGRIVLIGRIAEIDSPFEAQATRFEPAALVAMEVPRTPGARPAGGGPAASDDAERERRRADFVRRREVREKLSAMLADEGAAVVLEPDTGRGSHYGNIVLGGGGSRDAGDERAPPNVVVSAEQWNRIARLLAAGQPVQMKVDVQVTFHDSDLQGYNVVGEIPGADPRLGPQLVMLGAHLDSWHPATGATDNGVGSAVAMEAVRLIQSLGRPPRRTIRIALWTGEEQGLLGSRGYVKRHFADPDTMALLPEHSRLSGYFNLDNGGGRIRGVYLQGNAACRPIFDAWLAPFRDLDAQTLTLRDTGGTDHLAFDAVGLPGFQFIQDPLDYDTRTHHTLMDLYERVIPDDARQAAVIMAAFVWQAAMRDELLPREPLPEPRNPPAGG